MRRNQVYFFLKGPLSQWHMSGFTVGGVSYSCAEQYMMAQKALFFGDNNAHAAIMSATEPREVQALGRGVVGFKPDVWDAHKQRIVYEGNLTKFRQHADLCDILLSTGEKLLAEDNPVDRVWGIGMSRKDLPRVLDRRRWGKNLLGKALMAVRATLRAGG